MSAHITMLGRDGTPTYPFTWTCQTCGESSPEGFAIEAEAEDAGRRHEETVRVTRSMDFGRRVSLATHAKHLRKQAGSPTLSEKDRRYFALLADDAERLLAATQSGPIEGQMQLFDDEEPT